MTAQHNISETAEGLLKKIRSCTAEAEKRLSAAYVNTKESVVAGAKSADKTIRDHPYESLAIALGVGVLVGLLISRRSDD